MVRRTSQSLTVRQITKIDIDQFAAWEDALADSGAISAAQRLSDAMSDVRRADADECWRQIWTKPLYSNTKVAIGESYEKKLAPFMKGAWCFIGDDREKFFVEHDGGGNKKENYSAGGSIIEQIREVSGIAAKRLLAIQGGAAFLRAMVAANGASAPLACYAVNDLDAMLKQLATLSPTLRQRLGRGWGHITVMHMLTDFGLSVKPDLHLVRTARHLGLVSGLRDVNVPSEREAMAIVTATVRLVQARYGEAADPAKLRYTDKFLMEASREKLIAQEPRNSASNRLDGNPRTDLTPW